MVLGNRPLLPTHSHLYITPLGNLTFLPYCLSFGLSQVWGICYIFQVFDATPSFPVLLRLARKCHQTYSLGIHKSLLNTPNILNKY